MAGISAASAFVSLVASCFIVFVIVLFKKWRFFTQRLVVYLAISVGVQAMATIIHRVDYRNETSAFYVRFCKLSGYVEHNTSWMELMSIVIITLYIFLFAMFRKRTDRLEYVYLFFIFVFPVLFNWIPFTLNVFGRAGAWCWIASENIYTCEEYLSGQVLQFVLWYIPLYVILIILISLYIAILVKINCYHKHKWTGSYSGNERKLLHKKLTKEIRPLMSYPLIYFVLNIIPLINRINGIVNPDNPILALWVLSGLLFPLKGGAIAMAFVLLPETRKRLKPVYIKSAFKQLCRKSEKAVMEYPAEHLASSTEEMSSKETYVTDYYCVDENGIKEDIELSDSI